MTGDSKTVTSVLVVDDNTLTCTFIGQLLAESSIPVLVAHTMSAALGILASENTVALLLCDFRLPDGSGVELARKASLLRPRLKVLIMSGYDIAGLGYDFIPKPFDPGEFVQKVETLLER
jgi:DNA-binding NtrC family response regulator